MRNRIRISTVALLWGLIAGRSAIAAPAQEPLFLTTGVSPMVMFAMSVDHQLFQKAFADYSDLNRDGVIDNTYMDSFDYYGYFDSKRCYEYDGGNGYFEPREPAGGANSHHCNNAAADGNWSGNFLNWATMTRIDVLRKALYGGKRAIDTPGQTVLQRELLPNDVHAFVKVFTPAAGDSMQNYTPYAAATISMCNSTPGPGGNTQTQNVDTDTWHPKLRIANGDWGRWTADEVYQCEWRGNGISPGNAQNLYAVNTNNAPSVRVKVCEQDKLESNCRSYNGSDYKPIGLLQEYGENRTLRFGLVSGSYDKRDKGGVLRKAVSYFAGNDDSDDDEVNLATGVFNAGVHGIVDALDRVRINAWDYTAHKYQDCSTYGIPIANYLSEVPYNGANVKCSNWGNPVSELYLEAVRYLIGEGGATPAFNTNADPLGLQSAAWNDPMPPAEWCTPMNVVLLSSGDNSFDTDHLNAVPGVLGDIDTATNEIGAAEGLGVGDMVFIGEVGAAPIANPDSNICTAKAFTSLSQMRGLCPATPTKQGGYAVAGLAYKAHTTDLRADRGNNPGTGAGQTISTYAIAMAKNLPNFRFKVGDDFVTVVPNAYAGPTNAMPPVISNLWKAASLAQLEVEDTVYDGDGNLVYARFLAYWEDSAWGNDYDMDVVSRVSVCVAAECTNHDDDGSGANDLNPGAGMLRVTTRTMHAAAGVSTKVGFVISGTDDDGDYATLRRANGLNFSSFDDDPLRDGSEPDPVSYTFTPGASMAVNLPTPLQLAAKYGSFKDTDGNDEPNLQSEWDDDFDGVADTFFSADDPSLIGPKLASYLATIATTSSAASVVANSVSLQTTTRIYQARFDSTDWSGSVVSFPVDLATGALLPAEWDAADQVAIQDWESGREWLTWNSETGQGVAFTWDDGGTPLNFDDDTTDLSVDQRLLLSTTPNTVEQDDFGMRRLEYLRGNNFYELGQGHSGPGEPAFRDRSNPLGDVVHSTPTVVGSPNFPYPDYVPGSNPPVQFQSVMYSAFKAEYANTDCADAARDREPMLYFGGNDGALHGVSACTGAEKIAYVPSAVFPNLNKLPSTDYSHQYYVDGAPTVVDAFFDAATGGDGAWHTLLVGTLAAGGPGVFALDVTDPGTFAEANADDIVLWDKTPLDPDSDYSELGYTFSQPAVVKAEGHGWVTIFGNGYDSLSGHAVLYVANVVDGSLIATIDVGGVNNGLSTVAPIDRNGDGLVDLIYAGDLNGNVWRFASNGAGFSAANTTLLYSAESQGGVAQPITSRIAVGYHPTSAVGRMVFFGTGKYYEPDDQDPNTAVTYNTMYGIWDRDTGATVPTVGARNSNVLQQQAIETQTVETDFYVRDANGDFVLDEFGAPVKESYDIRVLSNTQVGWAKPAGNCGIYNADTGVGSCGWYLDLTDTGEKMVATPILRGGRLIFVTTVPSLVACDAGGTGWLMELDPSTGGRLDFPVFDLNGDGVFDLNDDFATDNDDGGTDYTPVSGKRSKAGILQPPAILAGIGGAGDGSYGGVEGKYASGSKNAQIEVTIENPGLLSAGRKSWMRIK